jgi:hypothetical protein
MWGQVGHVHVHTWALVEQEFVVHVGDAAGGAGVVWFMWVMLLVDLVVLIVMVAGLGDVHCPWQRSNRSPMAVRVWS